MDSTEKRILIVDDEPDIRAMLKRAVERVLKLPADTAASGLEALEQIRERHYHVMVTDIAMPEMDGLSLFRAVKERHPEIQVIVLTATASVETSMAAVKSHVFSYLTKPVSMDRFVKEIQAALADQEAKASASAGGAGGAGVAIGVLGSIDKIAEDLVGRMEGLAGLAPVNAVLEAKNQVIRLREQLRNLRMLLEK